MTSRILLGLSNLEFNFYLDDKLLLKNNTKFHQALVFSDLQFTSDKRQSKAIFLIFHVSPQSRQAELGQSFKKLCFFSGYFKFKLKLGAKFAIIYQRFKRLGLTFL